MVTLGLYLIVKNEDRVIERCITSFSQVYDELVIVDTGSSDRTKDIAKKYTSKVYDFEWCNDFSKARNYALSKVESDWAMWCDADDVFVCMNPRELRRFLDNVDEDGYSCIDMVYQTYVDEKTGEIYESITRERIHKKEAGPYWEGIVHETCLLPESDKYRGSIFYPNAWVVHRPPQTKSNFRNGYLKLLEHAIETESSEKAVRYYLVLGREYAYNKMFDKAIDIFTRRYHEGTMVYEKAWCAYELAQIYLQQGDYKKTKEWALKCIYHDMNFKYAYIMLAEATLREGDYAATAMWLQFAVLVTPSINMCIRNVAYDTYYPYYLMYFAYVNMGNYKDAQLALLQAYNNGLNKDEFIKLISELEESKHALV